MSQLIYTAPSTKVIEVRFVGNILYNSPDYTNDRTQRPNDTGEVDF